MRKKLQSKSEKIVSYTADELKRLPDETDYDRLDALKDENIDYSDIPATDEAFWADAKVVDPGAKKMISIRLDEDVLEWYKHQGGRYQRIINKVLRQYMDAHQ